MLYDFSCEDGGNWLIQKVLAGSKFVVIELTALVFGSYVYLGGFWSVTALILVLMGARYGVRWLFNQLMAGTPRV